MHIKFAATHAAASDPIIVKMNEFMLKNFVNQNCAKLIRDKKDN